METNHLDETAEEMNKTVNLFQKAVDELISKANTPEDKVDMEEFKNSTTFKLYTILTMKNAELLHTPAVQDAFEKFNGHFGKEISTKLMDLLIVLMTHSSFNAIIAYDSIIKEEIQSTNKEIYEALNILLADDQGHDMAIKEIRDHLKIIPGQKPTTNDNQSSI